MNRTSLILWPEQFLLLALLIILSLQGCASSDLQTDLAYSELARSVALNLDNDGYVVGIEKRGRDGDKIDNPPEKRYPERYQEESEGWVASVADKEKRKEKFIAATDDLKVMLVTHVVSYTPGKVKKFLYNAYQFDSEKASPSVELDYEAGYKAGLCCLTTHLKGRLDKSPGKYTHILIMSMGWNNDQHESIWRYNRILKNIKKASGGNFRPLVIAFTWPSVWRSYTNNVALRGFYHLSSYFNKAVDADEVGYTLAN